MTKDEEKLLLLMGKRIKELRINANFKSQEAFAYEANIPRAQYGRYEAGSNITILSLNKILKFHKLSFDDFFKGMSVQHLPAATKTTKKLDRLAG